MYERRDIKKYTYIHSFVQKKYGKDKLEAKEKDYYYGLNCSPPHSPPKKIHLRSPNL